jgi:hypothetical protein
MPCNCGKHKTPQGCAGAKILSGVPWAERCGKARRPRSGPLCACGCGQRCHTGNLWASLHCVPRDARKQWGLQGSKVKAQRFLRNRFKGDIERLAANGGRFTQGELLATFQAIYERGVQATRRTEYRQRKAQEEAA